MPPLWLIGMMGAGKSTVGAEVAAARGVEHVDIDERVVQRAGKSISEIFESGGEEEFRSLESREIDSIAKAGDAVVSTGGGSVLDPQNVLAMRGSGAVVMLKTSVETLVTRIGETDRPLLAGRDPAVALGEILEQRSSSYEAAADYVIDADQAVADVATLIGSCDKFSVSEDSHILVGSTLPRRLLAHSERREQAVVVCQQGSLKLARAVMARLEEEVDAIAMVMLPEGESAKTMHAIGASYEQLAKLTVGRHDTIVGVGGGAVTDVAGFLAATWLRGIESSYVPTTMLGAVDASIGGKTGINVMGKNLVGAFWHPTRVSISLGILDALPEHLKVEGAAEAIKAGFIADPQIVELYSHHGMGAPVSEVVRRAVAVKAEIVAEDFRERGKRAVLNFGHTIGHGIEAERALSHGQAVAVGMVAAAAISQQRYGLDPTLVSGPLEMLGLRIEVAGADGAKVREFIGRDKKRTEEGLQMVLLRDVGDPVVELVDSAAIDFGLAAVGIV